LADRRNVTGFTAGETRTALPTVKAGRICDG
jgi:hypothetical protein